MNHTIFPRLCNLGKIVWFTRLVVLNSCSKVRCLNKRSSLSLVSVPIIMRATPLFLQHSVNSDALWGFVSLVNQIVFSMNAHAYTESGRRKSAENNACVIVKNTAWFTRLGLCLHENYCQASFHTHSTHTHEATAVVTQVHIVVYAMHKCNCMCMVHVNYCVIV